MNKDHDDFLDSFGSDRPASGHDKAPTDGASDTPPDGIDNLADDEAPPARLPAIFMPPDVQAAKAALKRAMTPALRKALRRGPIALVLIAPGPDWCAPVKAAARQIIGEGPEIEASNTARDPWLAKGIDRIYFTRITAERYGRIDLSGVIIPSALSSGGSVIGIAADTALLPSQLLQAADFTLTLGTLTGADVMAIVRSVTGERLCPPISDALARSLSPPHLAMAIRKGTKPSDCVARLTEISRRLTIGDQDDASVPTLDQAVGYGPAQTWGLALAADIDRRRADPSTVSVDTLTRSLLLAGAPGVGKTFFARILAKTCGIPLISTSYGDFQSAGSGHLGDVMVAMRKAFADAKNAAAATDCGAAILLIDEIDSIPGRHTTAGTRNADWWASILNALLTLTERNSPARRGVILIGCSNYAAKIDPALKRSGRLSPTITLTTPTPSEFAAILRLNLAGKLPDADLSAIAGLAVGLTGADAARFVRDARQVARDAGRDLVLDDLVEQVLPPETRPPAMLRRLAVHEAGHAVIGVILDVFDLDIVTLCTPVGQGVARFKERDNAIHTAAHFESLVVLKLSGRAADGFFGDVTANAGGGEGSDLADASSLLAAMHRSFGLRDGLISIGSSEDAAAALKHDAGLRALVESDLQRLDARAKSLVAENREAIVAIADALVQRRVLSGAEVRDILEQTASAKLKGVIDAQ